MLRKELDDIKGIGPKTKETLLKQFKSVKNIKETSFEELSKAIGEKKAHLIIEYFENKKDENS